MNFRLLFKLLGILALLIGIFMLFSLFWASPRFGQHTDAAISHERFEREGFWGLLYSTMISFGVAATFLYWGRSGRGKLFRKEAMAVVGLSWVLATFLGALPFVLGNAHRGPSIRVFPESKTVMVVAPRYRIWESWNIESVTDSEFAVLQVVVEATARGVSPKELAESSGEESAEQIFEELRTRNPFEHWLISPSTFEGLAPADRASNYRMNWVPMGLVDAMFEAQSGFSTTGATVLSDLEDPYLVPHCILFWRASTHFLGGLGIIVLFVVLLGQGSAGKALMRTEVPGPTQDNSSARMQHSAWLFAGIYVALNAVLAIILFFLGMNVFDAISHAFATMATGGFSTYNASLGHFQDSASANGDLVEYVVILFMILAGTNFTLLALSAFGEPGKLLRDIEFRTYMGLLLGATAAIIVFGIVSGDQGFGNFADAFRNSLFQVVSIVTTTGYGTADFDQWNNFGRGVMLILMFVGGCSGSTGGGMKVIRHVLFVKILSIEVEQAFHPKVVRLLRVGGKPVEDNSLRHSILVYFCLIVILFIVGFLFLISVEPDNTWGLSVENKLIDSISAVAATLNNIGPGLGTVGATQNYGHFSLASKMMFVVMMMLGRLEIFPILVLFSPRFWRDQ